MGPRTAWRQRHRRRLQGCALFRGRRGALLLRRHVSDPESHPRQSHHRAERLCLTRAAATNQQIKEAEMPEIVTQQSENILQIQFNRPEKKNAMTLNMYSTVAALLNAAAKDDETRVVLLHGAGDASISDFYTRTIPSVSTKLFRAHSATKPKWCWISGTWWPMERSSTCTRSGIRFST